jgi:hypothetical protein
MADLAAFGEESFDVKAYVNAACANRAPDEPLERFLSELEMRLQLTGEELEVSLTDASAAAIRRVPYAQQEIARLKGDIASLQVRLPLPWWSRERDNLKAISSSSGVLITGG